MNYTELSRQELENVLLHPDTRAAEAVLCKQRFSNSKAICQNRRRHQLRHALKAAHELLTRIAEQEIKGRRLMSSTRRVRDYLQVLFAGAEREFFVVIYLDSAYRAIEVQRAFFGTLDSVEVHPREIVRHALLLNAAAVICAHPHPSMSDVPSQADIQITHQLKSALELVEVKLLDHFVVAGAKLISCAEEGHL